MDADTNPVTLRPTKPFTTLQPSIHVRGLLQPGEYQFQLVVTDVAGNRSQPALVRITVDKPATLWLAFRRRLMAVLEIFSAFLRR